MALYTHSLPPYEKVEGRLIESGEKLTWGDVFPSAAGGYWSRCPAHRVGMKMYSPEVGWVRPAKSDADDKT